MAKASNYDFLMDSFNRDSVSCYNVATSSATKDITDCLAYIEPSKADMCINNVSVVSEIETVKDKISELDKISREALRVCHELKQNITKQQYKYLTLNMEWEPI